MSMQLYEDRIPEERLAEQWYGLMHGVMAKLQAAFRTASKERGLTQRIIAKRLGKKSPEVVSRSLSGQKNMTLRTLHDLARAMDCRLDIQVTPLASLKTTNRSVALSPPKPELELPGDKKKPVGTSTDSYKLVFDMGKKLEDA